jgi:arylsulfatase A-like enzyme
MDELYDLAADPHEMRNLAGEPSSRAVLGELKAELERLKRELK